MASKKDVTDPRSPKMQGIIGQVNQPFEASKIKQVDVMGGKKANYVKSQEYIVRLNEVFGVAWSAEILQHWQMDKTIMIWVRLTYPNPDNPEQLFFKDGIAGHIIRGEIGNAFKSAYSKAFTIAAAKIGIGLHLWGVDAEEDEAPTWDQQAAPVHGSLPNAPVYSTTNAAPPPVPGGYNAPAAAPPATTPPLPAGGVPQFVNNEASSAVAPAPSYNAPPAPPPLPVGNPAAGVDSPPAAVGFAPTPGAPAAASVSFQAAPTGGGIKDFQINGIVAAAVTRAVDPLALVYQILGDRAQGLTAIEQLTAEHAGEVMLKARQLPPQ